MYLFQFISGAVPSRDIITKDLPILDSSKKSIKTEEVPVTNSSEVQLNSIENHDANPEISSSRILVLADTDTYSITATFAPEDKNSNPSHENSGKEFNSDDNIDLDLEVTEEEANY